MNYLKYNPDFSAPDYLANVKTGRCSVSDHAHFFACANSLFWARVVRLEWQHLYLEDCENFKIRGYHWNIYTAFVINQLLERENRLLDYLTAIKTEYRSGKGTRHQYNVFDLQEKLKEMLGADTDEFLMPHCFLDTSWDVCTPRSVQGFFVKRKARNEFLRCFGSSCELLAACIDTYLTDTLLATQKQSGYVFDAGFATVPAETSTEIGNMDFVGRIIDRRFSFPYPCNHLLPIYGIEI